MATTGAKPEPPKGAGVVFLVQLVVWAGLSYAGIIYFKLTDLLGWFLAIIASMFISGLVVPLIALVIHLLFRRKSKPPPVSH
jgi:cytochrome c oxidase subunit IV